MEPSLPLLTALLLAPLAEPHAAETPGPAEEGGAQAASRMREYNVVWDSPSRDSLDSMPLAGMWGAGANVWMQDGHLWIYLAHNGAYDERGRLLKLGCIRITPTDTPWEGGRRFLQKLDLEAGGIRIEVADRPDQAWSIDLWFAGQTLVAEVVAEQAEGLEIAFGTWRDMTRTGMKLDMRPTGPVGQDVVTADAAGLRWAHHNADHPSLLAERAGAQNMPPALVPDPTARLVFGGALVCDSPLAHAGSGKVAWQDWQGSAWTVRAPARRRHHMAVALRAQKDGNPDTWAEEARALLDANRRQQAREAGRSRWREFWGRSFIHVNPWATENDPGWQVGRNYQLFRYMLACNQDGALPLLFNGGIFTADNPKGRITANLGELAGHFGEPSSPDFRRWLFCHFMGQNQRWLGWPTIAGGDLDLLEPSLRFYRDRAAVARERARGLGAEGLVYPEPIDVWGLCGHMPLTNGLCGAAHLTHHFAMGLEHAWMALVARDVLGRDIGPDLDWIQGTVRFLDSYYRAETLRRTGTELGDDGRLLIHPANGLELIIGARNPIEIVAGLQQTVSGLLRLDDGLLAPEDRAYLTGLRARLPVLPVGVRQGEKSLLEAESYDRRNRNLWELSEFYAAWPYRLVGVTRPETLELLRATWRTIPEAQATKAKQDLSWMATLANVAAMGDAAEARQRAIDKLSDQRAQVRFPAFFGPGHDWLPDHNWGGSGMVGLQEMLVAAEPGRAGKIYLLPAWPRDWDVVFKLHVPGPAVVEGELKGGRLISLSVVPENRRDAIVLPPDLVAGVSPRVPGEAVFPVEPPPVGSATGVFEDALRRLREVAGAREITNATLLVAPGTYWLDRTWVVTPQSLGKFRGRLVIAAAPGGARPVLLGSREMRDWEPAKHELLPAVAVGKVWMAALPSAHVPKTLYDAAGMLPRSASGAFRLGNKGTETEFSFPGGILPRGASIAGLELSVRPFEQWCHNVLPIASLEHDSGRGTTALPCTYKMTRPRSFVRYDQQAWLENHPALITEPGRWAADPATGQLYLWPRREGKPEGVRAGDLTELVRLAGDENGGRPLSGITLRGLTFSQAERDSLTATDVGLQHDWDFMDKGNAMVRLRWVEEVTVEDCHFVESGASGLRADLFAQHVGIRNNVFRGLGGGGVLLCGYGPGTKDLNKHNEVTGNLVEDCARLIWHMPGIHVWQSGDNRIARNLVRDLPYNGVVVSGNAPHHFKKTGNPKRELDRTIRWAEVGEGPHSKESIQPFLHSRNNIVEGNEITRVMQKLGDGNGIYVRFASETGNAVRNNYVHDIPATAIRCDGQQGGVTIEGNLIVRAQGSGLTSKEFNVVRNNFIVDVLNEGNSDTRREKFQGYMLSRDSNAVRGSELSRNVFLDTGSGEPAFYHFGTYPKQRIRAPRLSDFKASNNLYWVQGNPAWARAFVGENHAAGTDPGSRAEDPGMEIVEGRICFRGKVLEQLGIKPFDWKAVGR